MAFALWFHAEEVSPYLSQGERGLPAGAALDPEFSWLYCLTGALAVNVEAVVGRSACRDEKAETKLINPESKQTRNSRLVRGKFQISPLRNILKH